MIKSGTLQSHCKDHSLQVLVLAEEFSGLAGIKNALERELPGYSLTIKKSLGQAQALVNRREFVWLIITESVPRTLNSASFDHGDERNKPSGVRFAESWLSKDTCRKAILVTRSTMDRPWAWKQIDRLIGIRETDVRADTLADVIHAGDVGATYCVPTVIRIQFEVHRDRLVARFRECFEGPLAAFVSERREELRSHRDQEPPQLSENWVSEKPLRHFVLSNSGVLSSDTAGRKDRVVTLARSLGNDEHRELAEWLARIAEEATQCMFPAAERHDPWHYPCPIQLHIIAQAEMMAFPFDLHLHSVGGRRHLGDFLPITWRIKSAGPAPRYEEEVTRNPTNYAHYRAVYSCRTGARVERGPGEPDWWAEALPDSATHIGKILDTLRPYVDDEASCPVDSPESLRAALAVKVQPACAYVITHGFIHGNGDDFGVLVAPETPGGGKAKCVTAVELKADIAREARRFIYFNCCSLGHQLSDDEASNSYFGGFVEAALKENVCREAIFNRWQVSATWAQRLAEEFYSQRPRTAQGRADALLKARFKIAREMDRADPEKQDYSALLAPMHVWRT